MSESAASRLVKAASTLNIGKENEYRALDDPACLHHAFTLLTDEVALAHAACVCKQWHAVARSEDIWKVVYQRRYGHPQPQEWLGSFRRTAARAWGLRSLHPPRPALVKGTAVAYNPAARCIAAFSARQRLLSVQFEGGRVRSVVLRDEGRGTADPAHMASAAGPLVVLAAFDGMLQVWDVASLRLAAVLGGHSSYVTSLAADGDLVASTCATELRLWSLRAGRCLFSRPLVTAAPLQVEPRVVVSEELGLMALANHSFPSGTVQVLSAREGSYGQLLQTLQVNCVSAMLFCGGRLVVASCFQGRSLSGTSPAGERPFTVVATSWDTDTWASMRLVSPRLWSDTPSSSMSTMPVVAASQGTLLVCALRSGAAGRAPCCAIHGWTLPPRSPPGAPAAALGGSHHAGIVLTSVRRDVVSAAAAAGGGGGGGRGGAPALASASVLAAAGVASSSVMLPVGEGDRQTWAPVLDDTHGCVVAMLTTPRHVVFATDLGQVYLAPIPYAHSKGEPREVL